MTRQGLQISIALFLGVVISTRSAAEPPPRAQAQTPRAKSEHESDPAVQERARATRRAAWRALTMLRGLRTLSDIPPAVREELRQHAQRMARLQRIRELAVQAHDQAALQRADKLIGREQVRDHDKLARVWPAPPATSAPAAVEPKLDDPQDEDTPRERDGEDDEDQKEGEP